MKRYQQEVANNFCQILDDNNSKCNEYYNISNMVLNKIQQEQLPKDNIIKLRIGVNILCFDVTELYNYLNKESINVLNMIYGQCVFTEKQLQEIQQRAQKASTSMKNNNNNNIAQKSNGVQKKRRYETFLESLSPEEEREILMRLAKKFKVEITPFAFELFSELPEHLRAEIVYILYEQDFTSMRNLCITNWEMKQFCDQLYFELPDFLQVGKTFRVLGLSALNRLLALDLAAQTSKTSLLYQTIINDAADILQVLIDNGLDINAEMYINGETIPLIMAIEFDAFDIINTLLQHPTIDINKQNNKGQSALTIANLKGNVHLINQLLSLKADPNIDALTYINNYVLESDSQLSDIELVSILQQLLQYGLQITPNMKMALITIVKRIIKSQDIDLETKWEFLETLQKKVDINELNYEPKRLDTLLTFAISNSIPGKPNEEVTMLLALGVDPNQASDLGQTPLLLAMDLQLANIVQQLLEVGANPNKPVKEQYRAERIPLIEAIIKNNHNVIDILLRQSNINVNIQDTEGHTPLWYAIENRDILSIKKLLSNKNINASSDINETDKWGRNALTIAMGSGDMDLVKQLLELGANPNNTDDLLERLWYIRPDKKISILQKVELLLTLLQHHLNITRIPENTIFYIVNDIIENKNIDSKLKWEVLKAMQQQINITSLTDKDKDTLLILSIIRESPKEVAMLLALGADPNFGSKDGTPLLIAVETKQEEIIKELLKAGADPNKVSVTEWQTTTPLREAQFIKSEPILKVLHSVGTTKQK